MLFLLRKIRRKLMKKNKFTTYLFYAIGEIILVVIGILIAVSLNNLNEKRKLVQTELKMLYEINENLKECQLEIEGVLKNNSSSVNSYYLLLDHFERRLPNQDTLNRYFADLSGWSSPYLTFTAYESLKQKGVDLISNDSLRLKITQIYENHFNYLINDWDRAEWRDSESIVGPYFSKNFSFEVRSRSAGSVIPNDYNELMNDREFKNILTMVIANREWGNTNCKDVLKRLSELMKEIDLELTERGYY